jgi:hypothetical protein
MKVTFEFDSDQPPPDGLIDFILRSPEAYAKRNKLPAPPEVEWEILCDGETLKKFGGVWMPS